MRRLLSVVIGLALVAATIGVIASNSRKPGAVAHSDSSTDSGSSVAAPPSSTRNKDLQPDHVGATATNQPATERSVSRDLELPTGLHVQVSDDGSNAISGASIWIIPLKACDFPPRREVESR